MVKCPNCDKQLDTPIRKLENKVFLIEEYACDNCGTVFRVNRDQFLWVTNDSFSTEKNVKKM